MQGGNSQQGRRAACLLLVRGVGGTHYFGRDAFPNHKIRGAEKMKTNAREVGGEKKNHMGGVKWETGGAPCVLISTGIN
jgi:hypothetical protein